MRHIVNGNAVVDTFECVAPHGAPITATIVSPGLTPRAHNTRPAGPHNTSRIVTCLRNTSCSRILPTWETHIAVNIRTSCSRRNTAPRIYRVALRPACTRTSAVLLEARIARSCPQAGWKTTFTCSLTFTNLLHSLTSSATSSQTLHAGSMMTCLLRTSHGKQAMPRSPSACQTSTRFGHTSIASMNTTRHCRLKTSSSRSSIDTESRTTANISSIDNTLTPATTAAAPHLSHHPAPPRPVRASSPP